MSSNEPGDDGDDQFRRWDAAYVLGALDPLDRRAFEEHMAGCAQCRAAVAELAGMPGLLRMLPGDDAIALLDEPSHDDGIVPGVVTLAAAARRSRRRSRTLWAAAAALIVVVVGVGGVFAGRALQPSGTVVAAESVALRLEPVGDVAVTADLTLERRAWGTRIDWSCEYPVESWPGGAEPTYELVLVDTFGVRYVVATWSAGDGSAEGLAASSSMPLSVIEAVEIRLAGSEEALSVAAT